MRFGHSADDLSHIVAGIAVGTMRLRVYGEARRMIDAEIAKAVPGVKTVDAQFGHMAEQGKALAKGAQAIPQQAKTRCILADVADTVATGTPETVLRLRQGAHADLDRRLGTQGQRIAKYWNRRSERALNAEKAAAVFGPQPAQDVIDSITPTDIPGYI